MSLIRPDTQLIVPGDASKYLDGTGHFTTPGGGGGGSTGPLAIVSYSPSSDYTTTSFSYVKVDATNLKVTFTAPTSGQVLLVVSATGNNAGGLNWGVGPTGAVAVALRVTSISNDMGLTSRFLITGLTSGTSYTYYLWFALGSSGTSTIRSGSYSPVIMEAWAA